MPIQNRPLGWCACEFDLDQNYNFRFILLSSIVRHQINQTCFTLLLNSWPVLAATIRKFSWGTGTRIVMLWKCVPFRCSIYLSLSLDNSIYIPICMSVSIYLHLFVCVFIDTVGPLPFLSFLLELMFGWVLFSIDFVEPSLSCSVIDWLSASICV